MSAIYIQVRQTTTVARKFQRITFYSPDFSDMPIMCAGLHIKLFFKKHEQTALTLPSRQNGRVQWPDAHLKPIARTYSIFDFNREKNELTVDFVLHNTAGPACDFARVARVGDKIGFAGPGPVSLVNRQCKYFIFSCDLSSLPAVSSVINSLNTQSNIEVFLEVEEPKAADKLLAEYLPNLTHAVTVSHQQFDPMETLVKPAMNSITSRNLEETSITIAGEHESVLALRSLCREHGVPKENLYAVPYWRHNQDEETYHQARHDVMDS